MKSFLALIASGSIAHSATLFTQSFSVDQLVPDGSTVGLLDQRTLSTGISAIESISITLHFSDGGVENSPIWNGDLYAYVAHGSGFTVLLNRIGRVDAGDPFDVGSGSQGMSVTFEDGVANGDIHNGVFSMAMPITGSWQPDGRLIAPEDSDASVERTTFLSSFHGLSGSGQWEIFVADVSGGGVARFDGWDIAISGSAVPEPGAFLGTGALIMAVLLKRRRPCRAERGAG